MIYFVSIYSWVYAFLIFLSIILRLVEDDNEEITLALAVVTGWAFCLFFARGFAFLGPYISMIQIVRSAMSCCLVH